MSSPRSSRRTRSSPRRAGDLGRGLGATLVLLALVVGVPALLAGTIGWPLPHSIPTLGELRDALSTTRIPDEAIFKTLAVFAWAYWLHLVWCLAVETAAVARGRLPRRVLLGGLNQAIASRLVAAILLLGQTSLPLRPTVVATAAPPPAVVREVASASPPPATSRVAALGGTVDDQPALPPDQPAEVARARPATGPVPDGQPARQWHPQPAAPPAYTVKRGDTLWGIAQREFGDPLRWRELERLNRGRLQPDGSRLEDPDLIRPGWQLVLPAASTATPPGPRSQPGGQHEPSGAAPSVPGSAAPPTTAPTTTVAPTSTTAAPTTTTPATPTTEAPTTAAPLSTTPPAAQRRHRPAGALVPLIAALSIGLLAAGVLAVLARLRRIQQRRVPRGRRIRLPTGPTADVELALRVAAEPEATVFLNLALRALAAAIRRDRLPVPAIQAALLTDTALEVLLEAPAAAAPAPFTATPDGQRWTLPRDTPLEDLAGAAADAVPPLPALVTIGQTPTDPPARLLVNLEAAGLLAVPGPPDRAAALLNAVAAELATASWSGFFELVLVGAFGSELALLERVQQAPSLEAVLPRLERRAAEATATLDQLGCATALEGRIIHTAGDSLVPTVVLCAEPPSAEALERLAAFTLPAAPPQPPLAAVLVGDVPAAHWQLRVTDDQACLEPLGIDVRPQQLDPAEFAAIGDLLRTAADTGGVAADAPPYDQLHPAPAPMSTTRPVAPAGQAAASQPRAGTDRALAHDTAPHDTAVPAGTVEVVILGTIELRGVPRIERAKAIETIVYLAMHPDGVGAERLWEALWPDKPVNRGTFHTTISAARSGLGEAPDGTPYLRHPHDGTYRLHPALRLDWATFQTLVEQSRHPGTDPTALLRQALELVRGQPLETTAPRSYAWAVVHRTEIETAIAEAAQDLGERCLDAGDPAGATWAARQGLLASPYDERLYRVLMRAAHTAGNPAGVDTVLRELLQVLGAEDDPVDELHPQTVELYRKLRPRRSILT